MTKKKINSNLIANYLYINVLSLDSIEKTYLILKHDAKEVMNTVIKIIENELNKYINE